MAISNFPPQAYTRDILASAYEWLRNQPPSIRELAQDSDSLVALYMQARRRGLGAQVTASTNSGVSAGLPAGAAGNGSGSTPNHIGHANTPPAGASFSATSTSAIEAEMAASSAQSFKQELKNLTEGLKQFDSPKSAPTSMNSATSTNSVSSTSAYHPLAPQTHPLSAPTSHYTPATSHATAAAAVNPPAASTHQATHTHAAPVSPTPVQHTPAAQAHHAAPAQTSNTLDAKSLEMIHQVRVRLNLGSETEALRMIIAIGFDRIREILPKN